jgi:hypothetical protein
MTRKRQKGGENTKNLKKAYAKFTVKLINTANQENTNNQEKIIKPKAKDQEKILNFYKKFASQDAGEIMLYYNSETRDSLRLKDFVSVENIQYTSRVLHENNPYEFLVFTVKFDVNIDKLWKHQSFTSQSIQTPNERKAFAKYLYNAVEYVIDILINKDWHGNHVDHEGTVILNLDRIEYNNLEYLPKGDIYDGLFYPHESEAYEFFSPYVQRNGSTYSHEQILAQMSQHHSQ